MRRAAILLLASSVLAGCALEPQYVQPSVPIAASYPALDGAQDATAFQAIAWKDFFGDQRLQTLIGAALQRNRDLAVSVAQIEVARAQYRLQRSKRFPEIDLSSSATRARQPLAATGAAGPGADSSITFSSYDVGVGVTAFELDFWGRVRNLSEAARRNYLATVEAKRAFRLSLIRDVAQTYLSLRETDERIVLAQQTLTSRREGLEIARLRLDAGVTSSIDYDQAKTLVTQAETALAALRQTKDQTTNLLTVLVGGPIAEPLPAARSLDGQGMVDSLPPGLSSALLVNRPDIRQDEDQLRAANANIGAARAAFFPTISLTAAAGLASGELSALFDSGNRSWNYGAGLGLPLFDAGGRKASLDVSKGQRDIAVATYQRGVQEAFREVADALAARRDLADQIAAQARAVSANRRLAETARLRYDNGIAIYLEVLDAERALFDSEQALIQLRGASLRNQVALYVALGGDGSPQAPDGVQPIVNR